MAKSLLVSLFLFATLTAGAQVWVEYNAKAQYKYVAWGDITGFGRRSCPDTTKCLILSWGDRIRTVHGGYMIYIDSCYFIRSSGGSKVVRMTNGTMIPQDRILLIK